MIQIINIYIYGGVLQYLTTFDTSFAKHCCISKWSTGPGPRSSCAGGELDSRSVLCSVDLQIGIRIPYDSRLTVFFGSDEMNLKKGQNCQAVFSPQNFASGLWWYFACGLSYSPASTTRDLQRMRTMWGFCSHAILCLESLASLSTTSGAIVRILQCLPTALFWQLLRAAIFVVRLLQRNLLEFTPGRCWKSSPLRAVSCFYRFHFCWFGENCHCFGLT